MIRHIAKLFTDKQGRTVLWQKPNAALVTWAVSALLSRVLPYGELNFIAALVAFGASFAWAWMELLYGVNYFRRFLGAAVLVYTVLSRL